MLLEVWKVLLVSGDVWDQVWAVIWIWEDVWGDVGLYSSLMH